MNEPTLHKPVPMQTRVQVPVEWLGPGRESYLGTVAGISSIHMLFYYIVILDCPLETEYGTQTAVSVVGTQLMDESGVYAWRLDA